jgi:hypothetical protein
LEPVRSEIERRTSMRANPRAVLAYLLLLLLIALTLGAARGERGRSGTPRARATGDASATFPDLAGSWSGGWIDTVFSVPGGTMFELDVVGNTVTGTGIMNLAYVGLAADEPFTISGNITGNTLTFHYEFVPPSKLTCSGDGTVTATRAGMTGGGNVGAPLLFGDFTFTGDADASAINASFTYGPGHGGGTFAMTRTSAVTPESWGGVKSRYRAGG